MGIERPLAPFRALHSSSVSWPAHPDYLTDKPRLMVLFSFYRKALKTSMRFVGMLAILAKASVCPKHWTPELLCSL